MNKLTEGTGAWSLPSDILPSAEFSLGQGKILTTAISSIKLSGLNTWKELDLLRPKNKYSLDSTAELDSLSFGLDFSLKVSQNATQAKPLYQENGSVAVSLSRNVLQANFLCLLNQTIIEALANDTSQVSSRLY